MQKREILKLLGFPGNNDLVACAASDSNRVAEIFRTYLDKEDFPFLILISEKPSRSTVPPLFIVRSVNEIIFRNYKDEVVVLSYEEVLKVIENYSSNTWVEFVCYLWGPDTIAGRLLYINASRQSIELQRGIIPRQLLLNDDKNLPVFSGSFNQFDFSTDDYIEAKRMLLDIGYSNIFSWNIVRRIVGEIGNYYKGLEELARIAPMPTLEFAIKPGNIFVCIDIDWPSQWKEVRH